MRSHCDVAVRRRLVPFISRTFYYLNLLVEFDDRTTILSVGVTSFDDLPVLLYLVEVVPRIDHELSEVLSGTPILCSTIY